MFRFFSWIFQAWLLLVLGILVFGWVLHLLQPWIRKRRFLRVHRVEMQNPQNAEVRYLLAEIYARGRSYREALQLAEEALAVCRQNPLYLEVPYRFLCLHGALLLHAGRPQEAIAAFEEALHVKSELGYASARLGLGRCRMRLGQWDEALGILLQAHAEDEAKFEIYFRLAQTYERLGRREDRREIRAKFDKLIRLLPRYARRGSWRWKLRFLSFPLTKAWV